MPANRPPILAPTSTSIGADVGRSVALSSLLRSFEPDGGSITQFELRDEGAGGGHFVVNGVIQAAQQTITLTAAQLANTSYVGGSESGLESFSIRAYDGQAWGAWMFSPVYTFERYAESLGTPGADIVNANGVDRMYLGLAGGDTFNVGAGAEVVLMGGRGDDTYVVPANGTAIVYETGGSSNDRLSFSGWSVDNNNFVIALVENRHLLLADPTSGGSVLLYDWTKPENRIEYFRFDQPVDARYADMIEFTFADAKVPNVLWSDAEGAALLDETMAHYRERLASLESAGPISVTDRTFRPSETVAAASLVQTSGPVARYEIQDWDFDSWSGYFTLNGVQQASGSATFVVTAAQFAQLQFVTSSNDEKREAIQVRADSGSGFGDWQSFIVTTYLNDRPSVRAATDFYMKQGQSVAASALFAVDDPEGNAITQYEFKYSTQGGAAYFVLDGVRQTADQPFVVSAAQLKDVRLVGESVGFDFVRMRAYDGQDWSEEAFIAVRPTATGSLPPVVTPSLQMAPIFVGQSVAISDYFSAYDPEGAALTYSFFDHLRNNPDDTGYFTLNGVKQDTLFTVSGAQLANVRFVAASADLASTVNGYYGDAVSVSVSDGQMSAAPVGWTMLTTLYNDVPDVAASARPVVMPGQKVPFASLFHSTDPDADALSMFVVTDAGGRPDSGYLVFNGVRQNSGFTLAVDANNMGMLEYVGGSVPGVETLYVSVKSDLSPVVTGVSERTAIRVTTLGVMQDGAGDTLDTARPVQLGTSAAAFNDYLGPNDATGVSDTVDYYRVDLSGAGTLRLDLTGLGANADLKLLDVNGATLATSARLGPTSEHISQAVSAGSFFVQVSAAQGVNTYYDLIVETIGNQPPTAVTLTNVTATLAENTAVSARLKLADIVVADDGAGMNTLTLTGADAASFEIVGAALYLRAGTQLDYESARRSYAVAVRVDDAAVGSTPDATSATYTLAIRDANDHAPAIVTAATQTLAENTAIVAALASTDVDTVGTNPATFTITGGADAARFTVASGNLAFASAPDFENPADADRNNSYVVQVTASDGAHSVSRTITTTVTNVVETMTSAAAATLPSSMDNLTLTGAADISGVGNARGNVITGNAGRNRLTGGAGDDTINGGTGVDTAVYSGPREGYAVGRSGASLTVSGADGTDTLSGVEFLQFGDVLVAADVSRRDFNADGNSDILLRSRTGALRSLNMDGTQTIGDQSYANSANWGVAGSQGDYNGDGRADIVLRNADTGVLVILQMNGAQVGAVGTIANSANWRLAGTAGDYDGDGRSDLLLSNVDTGAFVMLRMNGTQVAAVQSYANSANWALAGTAGDYNGDGRSDLLLRNADTGALVTLLMDGTRIAATGAVTSSAAWNVVGAAGDYNADGLSDLLLRNRDTGTLTVVQMNGAQAGATGSFANSANWGVVAAHGDHDGDGRSDVILRNADTGGLVQLRMNGTAAPAAQSYANSASWAVAAAEADYNGDGKADLLLQNRDSGALSLWLMNGMQIAQAQSIAAGLDWTVTV